MTGIAGPSGGSKDKPVGTVWFGFMVDGRLTSEMKRFDGDRAAVRTATVEHALDGLLLRLAQEAHAGQALITWASTPRRGAGPTGGA